MFFSYKDALTFVPVVIEGTILQAQTQVPLSGLRVYIIEGKEEAVTDKHGLFSIRTWRSLPVTIAIQQAEKIQTKRITKAQKPIRILVDCN